MQHEDKKPIKLVRQGAFGIVLEADSDPSPLPLVSENMLKLVLNRLILKLFSSKL